MRVLDGALARLLAGIAAVTIACVPLTAGASGAPSVDSLWNQADGIAIDSPFYVLQSWWTGLTTKPSSDPVERGIHELSQANVDLLNAFTLLQKEHSNAGPQPVGLIDPLLSTIYNAITGSNTRAPIGSVVNWIGQSLLKLEGRDSPSDLAQALLKDYQAQQTAALRDLGQSGTPYGDLLTANAQRQAAFLQQVENVAAPADGLTTLLSEVTDQTTAMAGHGQQKAAAASAGNGKSGAAHSAAGSGHAAAHSSSQPKPKSKR